MTAVAENGNLGPAVEASHAIAALCGTSILLFMYFYDLYNIFYNEIVFLKKLLHMKVF